MTVPQTEPDKSTARERIKNPSKAPVETKETKQPEALQEAVIECASPPCLLQEIEAGSRDFAY